MTKVLMVCLGNICRSPLAEGILTSLANSTNIIVDSAGTSAHHVGELPDYRSIEIARKNNIDLSNQRSRQFNTNDFTDFDVIYAMDTSNYQNICRMAPNSSDKLKVKLILNEIHPSQNKEVPDPYYGGEHGFTDVYNMLYDACKIIISKLDNER